MRKLASIQTVNAIEPIPGADAIERVRVLGWWVVVKKGVHRVGETLVYCEIDSFLPERAEFEFLRSSSFKPEIRDEEKLIRPAGFRIKTVKLRGQVSQGICFPLVILPPEAPQEVGADVSEFLGITKYEPPLPVGLSGKVKGPFPGFIGKTDETRVQVLEEVLERHRGKLFYLTEKLDGTSFTAFLREGEFGLCSRNQWLDESDENNLLNRLARRLQLEEKLRSIQSKYGFSPAIQGEVIGTGIQGNKYSLKGHELWVFNLFDLNAHRLIDHDLMLNILREEGLNVVPQLGTMILNHTIDELVALSSGMSELNSKLQREGIVLRPLKEEHDETLGGRLSFKAINPLFLLRYDE
jgi:RNA ligase (TIGR02306 family)